MGLRGSVRAGGAKAPGAALGGVEVLHHLPLRLHHRHDDHLRDALHRLHGVGRAAAVPAAHHQRTLIVGIDQTDQITQYHAVLVPQAGARQQHGAQAAVADVHGQTGGNELGLARLQGQGGVDASAQIHARAAWAGVGGKLLAQTVIEKADGDAGLRQEDSLVDEAIQSRAAAHTAQRPARSSRAAISSMSLRASTSLSPLPRG